MGWFAVLFLQGGERSWRLSSIIYGEWFNQSCLSNETFIKPQKNRVWRATWVEYLGGGTHLRRVWKLLSLSLHLALCSSFIWLFLRYVVCVQLRCLVWLFATPWTVAPRLLCPWDFPGKNTGEGWVAISFSKGSSRHRDRTRVSSTAADSLLLSREAHFWVTLFNSSE